MKMSNQACQCPGLKLGHQKQTPPAHNNPPKAGVAGSAEDKRIIKAHYAAKPDNHNKAMRGNFRLPGYETSRLQRLPTTQQNLFRPEQLAGMLEDFSKHIFEAIDQNRIQVPPSIQLSLNPKGNIIVDGSHPDQMKIEKLFDITPLLERKFHEIAFTSRVQQLASMQPGFKGEFFKLAPQSVQQITLVQIRAVELKPFRLIIDRVDEPATMQPDKQHQAIIPQAFRMVADSKEVSSASTDKQHHAELTGQAPIANNADVEHPVLKDDDKEEKRRHVHKGKLRCIINS